MIRIDHSQVKNERIIKSYLLKKVVFPKDLLIRGK